ncbi:MAG TPA: PIN domain-containing protein [Terriglobales bacterium]|nr:PIN domain-containing protein [Terriglobales bacterium]
MRVALDTNILAYAEGVNGVARKKAALAILHKLPSEETFVPVQALGELFAVLVRKVGRTPSRARDAIQSWQDAFSSIETSAGVLASAMDLAAGHNLGIWDSIILSASAVVGCRFLLSEDLQDGFTWNGVTVLNPFGTGVLERVLGE